MWKKCDCVQEATGDYTTNRTKCRRRMDAEIVDDGIYNTATGLGCCAQEGDKSAAKLVPPGLVER